MMGDVEGWNEGGTWRVGVIGQGGGCRGGGL